MREATVLDQVRENFAGEDDVVIPRPYPELSGPRVLTMTRLRGRRLDDVAADDSIDREAFALRAARIFVEMILRDRLFHADPHPGNVLVETGEDGLRYGILDWGEVGRIDGPLEDRLGASSSRSASGDRIDVADSLLEIVTAPPRARPRRATGSTSPAGSTRTARPGSSTSTSPPRSRTSRGSCATTGCGCRPTSRCSARR